MTKQVPWNESIYSEFCKLAMLSTIEREILRTRIMGYSITQQEEEFNLSRSTINRIINRLKKKYDEVQPLSEKLPRRRSSAVETWMDDN